MSSTRDRGKAAPGNGLQSLISRIVTKGVPFSELPLRRKAGWSQTPMMLAVVITCLLAWAVDPEAVFGEPLFVAGVLLTVLCEILAWTTPWETFDAPQAYLAIPSAALVAAILMAIGAYPTLTGSSLLLGFPIFWFAWSSFYPRLTLLLSFVLPLLTVWLQFWHHGVPLDTGTLLKPMLMPLAILALATTTVIAAHNTDLGERQLRETLAASRRQTHLLNAVLNAANVGVVVVDRDGNDLFMNDVQRFQHRHATPAGSSDPTEAELLVREVSSTYDPAPTLLDPGRRPVARATRQEEFTDELFAMGPPDDLVYLSTSARSFFDEGGQYDGSVTMFKNITPLLEASKTRDRFLANISHELRTPLTSILGYLELLQDDERLDDDQQQSLDVISRNSERMLGMVTDLLTVAAGQHVVKIAEMDLGQVVHRQLQSLKPRAAAAGVRLDEGNLCHEPVLGDALRLGQVLDNLVSNAIKYTAPGGSVTVSMACTSKEVSLTVSDTGQGISQADINGLFTRFFRTDAARRSGVPGVGLGLAISQELVRAHGGKITAESTLGEGTRMVVTMPRQRLAGDGPGSQPLGMPTLPPRPRK